jgi:hypothetical protein
MTSIHTKEFSAIPGNLTVKGNLRVGGIVTAEAAPVSGSGATVTLTKAQSGSTVLFDRAAGIIFTLPSCTPGLKYTFLVSTSVTSNNHKIITSTGTELFVGGLISNDTDTSGAAVFFDANGSTHIACTMNGTTTGGLIGTRIIVECISSTQWLISGINRGSGTVATPFATS